MPDSLPLRFNVAGPSESAFLASLGANVDRGGLFIPGARPVPPGTPVTLEFTLPNLAVALSCEGVVALCRPAGGSQRPGVLVRFTSMSDKDLRRIERAVAMVDGTEGAPLPERATPTGPPQEPVTSAGLKPRGRAPVAANAPETVIGIDFGATSCRASVLADRAVRSLNLEGASPTLPSAVAFDDRGRLVLGTRARAQRAIDPRNTVVGFARLLGLRPGSEAARELASRMPNEFCVDAFGGAAVLLRGRVESFTELAAHLLTEIRHRTSDVLGKPIRSAVLATAACSDERHRQALRAAAHLAGLKVHCVLGAPAAAALAFCHRRGLASRHLLVFDLGGSSFTASLVRADTETLEVLATAFEPNLGGNAFDARLAHFLETSFSEACGRPIEDPLMRQRVRDAAEAAKIQLGRAAETRVHVPWVAGDSKDAPLDLDLTVGREKLESLTADLVAHAVGLACGLCQQAGLTPAQVDEVLLVSGQSQAPAVRQALEAAFPGKLSTELVPTEAVSHGAAVAGWALQQHPRRSGPSSVATLSSPLHLALAGGHFHCLLERNATLPCEKACQVEVGPGGMIRLEAWQIDGMLDFERKYLGSLSLRAPPGKMVEAVFQVSRGGVLTLTARSPLGCATLTAATGSLNAEGTRELETRLALPETSGYERVDAKRLLAR